MDQLKMCSDQFSLKHALVPIIVVHLKCRLGPSTMIYNSL